MTSERRIVDSNSRFAKMDLLLYNKILGNRTSFLVQSEYRNSSTTGFLAKIINHVLWIIKQKWNCNVLKNGSTTPPVLRIAYNYTDVCREHRTRQYYIFVALCGSFDWTTPRECSSPVNMKSLKEILMVKFDRMHLRVWISVGKNKTKVIT